MAAYKIKAKFPGICDECGQDFDADSSVIFDNVEKVCWHVECWEEIRANEKSPIKPVQKGVIARYNPPKA